MAESFTGSVLNISDVHIGEHNSFMTPVDLLDEKQLEETSIKEPQKRVIVQDSLEERVKQCDVIVVNGDFRNAPDAEYEDTDKLQLNDDYVLGVIENWAKAYPQKTFYYTFGNHDGKPEDSYYQGLRALEKGYDNLKVTDYGVVIGDWLFMHGDMQEKTLGTEPRSAEVVDGKIVKFIRCYGMPDKDVTAGDSPSEDASNGRTLNCYLNLIYQLCDSEQQERCTVLRHGESEPSLLTAEELTGIKQEYLDEVFGGGYAFDLDVLEGLIGRMRLTGEHMGSGLSASFGHSHFPTEEPVELPNGKKLINSGSFRHEPTYGKEALDIDSPAKLRQRIIHFTDGVGERLERVFPDVKWEKLLDAAKEQTVMH